MVARRIPVPKVEGSIPSLLTTKPVHKNFFLGSVAVTVFFFLSLDCDVLGVQFFFVETYICVVFFGFFLGSVADTVLCLLSLE
jgi:hypothetical protein